MTFLKMLEVFNQVSMWLAEWIIVVILIDDIYGFKEIKGAVKKYGKMKTRRLHRQFLKTAKRYFRTKTKVVADNATTETKEG